jgi:glycine C-acetyltransferase
MSDPFIEHVKRELAAIEAAGTWKRERVISTPQGVRVRVGEGAPVLNLCANNYLGLAQHPAVIRAGHEALERWGYGMASVRFICGTQALHRELEEALSRFLGTESTILY